MSQNIVRPGQAQTLMAVVFDHFTGEKLAYVSVSSLSESWDKNGVQSIEIFGIKLSNYWPPNGFARERPLEAELAEARSADDAMELAEQLIRLKKRGLSSRERKKVMHNLRTYLEKKDPAP